MAATLGTVQPFRYRGYVYDEETGLYYLRSRYYSSHLCRFVNADSIISGNQYAYCKNSPVIHDDDSGFALCYCLDDQGLETSFLHYFMTGGGGGGSCAAVTRFIDFEEEEDTSKEYALYDNHRFNDDSVFHEQIFVVTVNEPTLDLPMVKGSAGVEFDLITGGWEWGNDEFAADISLFDIGHAELGGGFSFWEGEIKAVAMASIWSPSLSVTLFGIELTIGAEVGAVGLGGQADLSWNGGISVSGALGVGFNLGIDW